MRYFVQLAGATATLEVEKLKNGAYRVRDEHGRESTAELVTTRAGALVLSLAGQLVEAQPSEQEVRLGGQRFTASAESERDRASAAAKGSDARGSNELVAPMPGRIVRVACAVGEAVQKGSPLIVIEAMKMQNELYAKQDATVRAVHVKNGDTVERGAVLVELE